MVSVGENSSDVYNDYIDLLNGVVCDAIKWRLNHLATYVEYECWEFHMKDNFARCHTYEYLEDASCVVLGLQCVDEELEHLQLSP
jgi:hypothetical protein